MIYATLWCVERATILGLYAQGLFPMDESGTGGRDSPPELPWWVADPRTIFELDETSRAARAPPRAPLAAGAR